MSEEQRLAGVEKLSLVYFKLLSSTDWDDALLVAGLREGLNKFLSNAHLASFPAATSTRPALQQLEAGRHTGLVWEHLVPKTAYIQEPCERRARARTLTLDFIRDRLQRFWFLATITTEEDRLLARVSMPEGWDGMDVLARYSEAGLTLIPNPYFEHLTDGPLEQQLRRIQRIRN